jgi:hypothetical protein
VCRDGIGFCIWKCERTIELTIAGLLCIYGNDGELIGSDYKQDIVSLD